MKIWNSLEINEFWPFSLIDFNNQRIICERRFCATKICLFREVQRVSYNYDETYSSETRRDDGRLFCRNFKLELNRFESTFIRVSIAIIWIYEHMNLETPNQRVQNVKGQKYMLNVSTIRKKNDQLPLYKFVNSFTNLWFGYQNYSSKKILLPHLRY